MFCLQTGEAVKCCLSSGLLSVSDVLALGNNKVVCFFSRVVPYGVLFSAFFHPIANH